MSGGARRLLRGLLRFGLVAAIVVIVFAAGSVRFLAPVTDAQRHVDKWLAKSCQNWGKEVINERELGEFGPETIQIPRLNLLAARAPKDSGRWNVPNVS